MTFKDYPEFLAELRKRLDKPMKFIVPKVKPKELKIVHICCTIKGRCQWVSFPLILDEQQLEFIVHCMND